MIQRLPLQPQQSDSASDSTDETDEQHNVPPDHQPAEQIETSAPAESPRTTQATNEVTDVVDPPGSNQANPEKTTEPHRQHPANIESEEPADAAPLGIEQARRNTYEVAYDLASHYQLEPCVQPSPDWGLGFLVDLPDAPLIPDDARDTRCQTTVGNDVASVGLVAALCVLGSDRAARTHPQSSRSHGDPGSVSEKRSTGTHAHARPSRVGVDRLPALRRPAVS